MKRRRSADRLCASCGVAWPPATARFCGRCGLPLHPGSPSAGRNTGRRQPAWLSRTLLGGVLAVIAAALAVGLVLTGGPSLSSDDVLPDPGESTVELPSPGDVDGAAGSDDPSAPRRDPSDDAVFDLGSVVCEPPGCELWRKDLVPGSLAEGDGVVYHAGGSELTAIAVADGREVWRIAGDEGFGSARLIVPVGDTRLLIASPDGRLESRDPDVGHVQWRASLPAPVVTANVHGDALVVYGQAMGGAGDPDRFIGSLDLDTGEPHWVRGDVRPTSFSTEPFVVRTEAQIGVLDPESGAFLWRDDLGAPGATGRQILAAPGRVVVVEQGTTRVLSARTGELVTELAEVPTPEGWLQVIGSQLAIVEPADAAGTSDASITQQAPATVALLDLQDPRTAPAVYEDVIGLQSVGRLRRVAGHEGPQVAGLAMATSSGGEVVLTHLDRDGELLSRWSFPVGEDPAGEPACCWQLTVDVPDGAAVLVPPEDSSESVRRFAPDGSMRPPFPRPPSIHAQDTVWWYGETAVTRPEAGNGDDVLLAGERGIARVYGFSYPVAFGPPIVVINQRGLVAIDPTVLAGDR